ncbi:hypothetical protein EMCRGX_G019374 [Ephydatia muelleri]
MRTSRGADGRFRVLYWGFNPSTKAAAEEEIARWIAGGRDGWAPEEDGNNGEVHAVQYSEFEGDETNDGQNPSTNIGHKRSRDDMAAQNTTDEEDYFRTLRKRRRIQNSTDDEATHSRDNLSMDMNRDRHVTRIGGHMMCNSKDVEFDGIVQMDIDTHTDTSVQYS